MTISETPPMSWSGESPPPGWFPDPLRLWTGYQDPSHGHEWRWWDGVSWSPSVADHGEIGEDPIEGVQPAPPAVGTSRSEWPLVPYQPQAPVPYQQTAPRLPRVEGLAVASLVLGILWIYWIGSILAVIFGHVALSRIKRSNGWKTGRGMAIAGLVLGYVWLAAFTIFAIIGLIQGFTTA